MHNLPGLLTCKRIIRKSSLKLFDLSSEKDILPAYPDVDNGEPWPFVKDPATGEDTAQPCLRFEWRETSTTLRNTVSLNGLVDWITENTSSWPVTPADRHNAEAVPRSVWMDYASRYFENKKAYRATQLRNAEVAAQRIAQTEARQSTTANAPALPASVELGYKFQAELENSNLLRGRRKLLREYMMTRRPFVAGYGGSEYEILDEIGVQLTDLGVGKNMAKTDRQFARDLWASENVSLNGSQC